MATFETRGQGCSSASDCTTRYDLLMLLAESIEPSPWRAQKQRPNGWLQQDKLQGGKRCRGSRPIHSRHLEWCFFIVLNRADGCPQPYGDASVKWFTELLGRKSERSCAAPDCGDFRNTRKWERDGGRSRGTGMVESLYTLRSKAKARPTGPGSGVLPYLKWVLCMFRDAWGESAIACRIKMAVKEYARQRFLQRAGRPGRLAQAFREDTPISYE